MKVMLVLGADDLARADAIAVELSKRMQRGVSRSEVVRRAIAVFALSMWPNNVPLVGVYTADTDAPKAA